MPSLQSQVLREVSEPDVALIQNELKNVNHLWGPHYLNAAHSQGPLSHGQSVYLMSMHIQTNEILLDQRKYFQQTIQLVSSWTNRHPAKMARSYWHRLRPGEHIDCHRDVDSVSTAYFKNIERFHYYPLLPENFVVVLDGMLWNKDSQHTLNNRLIYFQHSLWHYYANHSSQSVEFLVCDFFKD